MPVSSKWMSPTYFNICKSNVGITYMESSSAGYTCNNFDWLIFTFTLHWSLQCYVTYERKVNKISLWQNLRFGHNTLGKRLWPIMIPEYSFETGKCTMQFCIIGNLQDIITSLRRSNESCLVENFKTLVRFSRKVYATSARTKQQLCRFKRLSL